MTETIAKVYLASPSQRNVPIYWAANMFEMWSPYVTRFMYSTEIPIDKARNDLAREFLLNAKDTTHLLFWDTDVLVPKESLKAMLEDDKPIVAGLYVRKQPPYQPVIYSYDGKGYTFIEDWKDGELLEVGGMGMGYCLIKREVLEKIKYPYFLMNTLIGSEDLYFCRKALNAGFKMYVDTRIQCAQVGHEFYTINSYKAYKEYAKIQYEKNMATKK